MVTQFAIPIEDIHLKIFHRDAGNWDKPAKAYYLVLPTPYIEMWNMDTPENRTKLWSFYDMPERERIIFDVTTASTFLGYETVIVPESEIKLIPRIDYVPDNPLPFDETDE